MLYLPTIPSAFRTQNTPLAVVHMGGPVFLLPTGSCCKKHSFHVAMDNKSPGATAFNYISAR